MGGTKRFSEGYGRRAPPYNDGGKLTNNELDNML
jgi:hypothetical protein